MLKSQETQTSVRYDTYTHRHIDIYTSGQYETNESTREVQKVTDI